MEKPLHFEQIENGKSPLAMWCGEHYARRVHKGKDSQDGSRSKLLSLPFHTIPILSVDRKGESFPWGLIKYEVKAVAKTKRKWE